MIQINIGFLHIFNINIPTDKSIGKSSECYTLLIVSLQKLLNGQNISFNCVLFILKLIVNYINNVIEETSSSDITYCGTITIIEMDQIKTINNNNYTDQNQNKNQNTNQNNNNQNNNNQHAIITQVKIKIDIKIEIRILKHMMQLNKRQMNHNNPSASVMTQIIINIKTVIMEQTIIKTFHYKIQIQIRINNMPKYYPKTKKNEPNNQQPINTSKSTIGLCLGFCS